MGPGRRILDTLRPTEGTGEARKEKSICFTHFSHPKNTPLLFFPVYFGSLGRVGDDGNPKTSPSSERRGISDPSVSGDPNRHEVLTLIGVRLCLTSYQSPWSADDTRPRSVSRDAPETKGWTGRPPSP